MSDCCEISCFLLCGFISSETLSQKMICPEQFTPPGISLQPVSKRSLQYMQLNISNKQKESFHFKKLTNRLSMAALASVEYRYCDLCWCYLQQTVHFFQSDPHAVITRDDVVSQRLKFGSAFLSSSWESKIALFF